MFAASKILPVVALMFAAGFALSASEAKAQFVVRGADGSLGFANGMGGHTFVYPERLRPGANNAVPGSVQNLPNGQIWLGQDGIVHGNILNPTTGDVHMRMRAVGPTGQKMGSQQSLGSKNFSNQKQSFPTSGGYLGRYRGR